MVLWRRSPWRVEPVGRAEWKSKVFFKENIGFRAAQGTAPGTPGGGLRAPVTSFGRPRAQPGRSGDIVLIKNHSWGSLGGHLGVVRGNFSTPGVDTLAVGGLKIVKKTRVALYRIRNRDFLSGLQEGLLHPRNSCARGERAALSNDLLLRNFRQRHAGRS